MKQLLHSREGPKPLGQSVWKRRFHGDSAQPVAQREGRLASGPEALRSAQRPHVPTCSGAAKSWLINQEGTAAAQVDEEALGSWQHFLVIVLLGQPKVRSWRPAAPFHCSSAIALE